MQLEHSFTVPVDIEKAWEVLLDIERVAPCMPGAVLDSVDGDKFTGRVKVKLGPVNLTYKGAASFIEKDAAAHRAVIDATGKDARGNGTAAAKVTATLKGEGNSTKVHVLTDLNITGKPAQFGRGVMVDVGNKLIGQFATCLEGKLTGEPEPAPTRPAAPEPDSQPAAAATPDPAAPAAGPADAPSDASSAGSDADTAKIAAPADLPAAAKAADVAAAKPARAPAPEPEPIDLLEVARGSVLTRVAPIAAGLLALLLIFLIRRRRH